MPNALLTFNDCQKEAWWLDLGRLSLGYGIGLLSYVVSTLLFVFGINLLLIVTLDGVCILNFKQVPVYIAEITPKNIRGGFTTVNQVLFRTSELF